MLSPLIKESYHQCANKYGRPLRLTVNNNGPKVDPWGTPIFTCVPCDLMLFIWTLKFNFKVRLSSIVGWYINTIDFTMFKFRSNCFMFYAIENLWKNTKCFMAIWRPNLEYDLELVLLCMFLLKAIVCPLDSVINS